MKVDPFARNTMFVFSVFYLSIYIIFSEWSEGNILSDFSVLSEYSHCLRNFLWMIKVKIQKKDSLCVMCIHIYDIIIICTENIAFCYKCIRWIRAQIQFLPLSTQMISLMLEGCKSIFITKAQPHNYNKSRLKEINTIQHARLVYSRTVTYLFHFDPRPEMYYKS